MRYLFVLLTFLAGANAAQAAEPDCGLDTPCQLGDRSYNMRLPDDWDGVSPMPVLLHFHGWQRTGATPAGSPRVAGATRRRGVLLIAPNGNHRTWDFWTSDTDDVEFAAAVIEDVASRFPIDRAHLYVSGYSYGSAMAWRYVCENGNDVAALLAVSGSISQNEDCPQAPHEVRHVHGLADTVMDFPFGPGGDQTGPVALWRRKLNCGAATGRETYQAVSWLQFQRTEWDNCAAGRVVLDVHPGGHFIPHGWIAWQLDDLLGRAHSYP